MKLLRIVNLTLLALLTATAGWWLRAETPTTGCPQGYEADWLPGRSEIHFDRQGLMTMLTAIGEAQRSIDVTTFLLGGEFGLEVLRALDRKAQAGVRVRLLYEDPANIGLGMAFKKALLALDPLPMNAPAIHFQPVVAKTFEGELAQSKIERRRFPLERFPAAPLKLAHDKLLLIDGVRAFNGGMNLHSSALGNHDAVIEVTGPAARPASVVFEHDWHMAGGQASAVPAPTAALAEWPERMRYRITRPGCANQHALLLELLAQARERVWLQMFYVTDTPLIAALVAARQRGVDVRVLQDPNEFSLGLHLAGAPNIAYTAKLVDAGVPLRLYRSRPGGQMHQKSLLVDDRWVVVGATNWTRQSFRVNTESSYLVDSQRQATRLAERFTDDWELHSVAPDAQRLQQRRAYSAMLRLLSEYL